MSSPEAWHYKDEDHSSPWCESTLSFSRPYDAIFNLPKASNEALWPPLSLPKPLLSLLNDSQCLALNKPPSNPLQSKDPLTGLLNIRSFIFILDHILKLYRAESKELTLLFIDIDGFKQLNATYGYAIGDEILRLCAKRLILSCPTALAIGRLIVDEFVVILDGDQEKDIESIISEVDKQLCQPLPLSTVLPQLSVSIGASYFPYSADSGEKLVRKAEESMYRNKEGLPLQDLVLESELRHSVKQDQLRLYYQPKIDLSSHEIVGYEALIRWQHPQYGLVSPQRFIPIAERSGLIHSIGRWIITTACDELVRRRQQKAPALPIAINIAAAQFFDPELIHFIAKSLNTHQLDSSLLEIEITESILIQNIESAKKTLTALRDMGVHITLDDFGTGFSSLSYLIHLPIQSLKIDKSFIDHLNYLSGQCVIEAIISLGHKLNLTVVAEGIETIEQLLTLQKMRCQHGQGFLIGRPHPVPQAFNRFTIPSKGGNTDEDVR